MSWSALRSFVRDEFTDPWTMLLISTPLLLVLIFLFVWNHRVKISRWLFSEDIEATWRLNTAGAPPSGPDILMIGEFALPMIATHAHTHRRVEKLNFQGLNQITRHVSVDVTVPHMRSDETTSTIFLPLGLIEKRQTNSEQAALRNFSARNEAGDSLPVATYLQNARIAYSALVFGISRLLVQNSTLRDSIRLESSMERELSESDAWEHLARKHPEIPSILWDIVTKPSQEALAICSLILDAHTEPGQPVTADADSTTPGSQVVLHRIFGELESLQVILQRVASSYLLAVQLHGSCEGQRVIVKFSLDDPIPAQSVFRGKRNPSGTEKESLAAVTDMPTSSPPKQFIARLLALFSVFGEPLNPQPMTQLPTQSFHFEAKAPDGLRFTRSALRVYTWTKDPGSPDHQSEQRKYRVKSICEDESLGGYHTLTHTFVSNVGLADYLSARLVFSPQSMRLALTSAMSWVLVCFLFVMTPTTGGDASDLQAFVMFFPAVATSYLFLSRHSMVHTQTRGIVALLICMALLATLSAGLLSVEGGPSIPHPPWLSRAGLWWALRIAAILVALCLTPATFRSWPNRKLGEV